MNTTFKGTMRPDVREAEDCQRCGHTLSSRARKYPRSDGLRLCTDCKNDTWLITKFGGKP